MMWKPRPFWEHFCQPSPRCCAQNSKTIYLEEHSPNAQKKCITKMIQQRQDMVDDPFYHVWNLVRREGTPSGRYIMELLRSDPKDETAKLILRIQQSTRTKYIMYKTLMNPSFVVHQMYSEPDIKEHERLAVTRFRLSSHNLAIERGRWSRTPRELRLCQCGCVQDEKHMIEECQNVAPIRERRAELDFSLPNFFDSEPIKTMVHTCHSIIKDFT